MPANRTTFSIATDLEGDIYRKLLGALAEFAGTIGLVVRPGTELSRDGQLALSLLVQHAEADSEATRWPGTRLLRGKARVIRLPATPEVTALLAELAGSLFSWRQPDLPEDLFFLRNDGSTLLGTISHEADAFLELSEEEALVVNQKVPELSPLLRLD